MTRDTVLQTLELTFFFFFFFDFSQLVSSHNLSFLDYSYRVVPIGLLYAMSLWLSNSSYLYLSVSFIQVCPHSVVLR